MFDNKAWCRKYYKEHREEQKAAARKRYYDNPERSRLNALRWRTQNPERFRANIRKASWQKAGINCTMELYNNLFRAQQGRCAICRVSQTQLTRRLAVDHDHKTREVRGLLCIRCNSMVLPTVETYEGLIGAAKIYLKTHEDIYKNSLV